MMRLVVSREVRFINVNDIVETGGIYYTVLRVNDYNTTRRLTFQHYNGVEWQITLDNSDRLSVLSFPDRIK